MKMKSKQDIFDENDLIFYYPDGGMVESKASKVFNAVDEYAQGVAIEFAKYVNATTWNQRVPLTPKQLFELFKKENNI